MQRTVSYNVEICLQCSIERVADLFIFGNVDAGSKRALRPVQQTSKHLSGLAAVCVDRLFAKNDKVGFLSLHYEI